MKNEFGKDKQYWIERGQKSHSDHDSQLCKAMIDNFDIREELQQARQATADRTKELEMVKQAYNELTQEIKAAAWNT